MAGKKKLTEEQEVMICWEYDDGSSGCKLADKYSVCYQTIIKVLERHGKKRRSVGKYKKYNPIDSKTKKCTKCGMIKDKSEFYKSRITYDGLLYRCKTCNNEHMKAWRNDKKNRYRSWTVQTMSGHRKRGIDIDISNNKLIEIAKKSKNCFYCGVPLRWDRNGEKGPCWNSPTLERINNEMNINRNNVVIICSHCNSFKSTKTLKEFTLHCGTILANLCQLNKRMSQLDFSLYVGDRCNP